MFFETERDYLDSTREEAGRVLREMNYTPDIREKQNFTTFFGELGYACKLILEEKEILFFALLQWVVVCIAYILWVQILDWIPDSLWAAGREAIKRNDRGNFTLINLVLTGWSFLVVAVASYPLSILNAAITAVHYLRSTNQTSTIKKCLSLAFKNLGRLWIFATIDAWITVNAILHRLAYIPSQFDLRNWRDRRNIGDEIMYYAWKIGTLGISTSLIAGKGFLKAGEESIQLLSTQPKKAIGIRMGYSAVCWVIGIISYIGGVIYFSKFGARSEVNEIYNFYFFIIVPIFIAVGITSVLVRPFFMVMVAKLYTDILPLDKEATLIAPPKTNWLAFIFFTLLFALLAMYFFGDELGIRSWVESLAKMDLHTYRQSIGK